jgi:hypothetical protein
MDLKRLGQRAKDLVDKRGGTESLKEDAAELKEIAGGQGSLGDKAKAAVTAIRTPGEDEAAGGSAPQAAPPPAADASAPERARAQEKVEREGRGKHAGGHGHGGGRGRRREGRGAGGGDSSV